MPSLLKRALVAGLSIATVTGLATIASAVPLGVKDKDKQDSIVTNTLQPLFSGTSLNGYPHGVISLAKGISSSANQNAQDEVARNGGIASLNIQSSHSVPISGSTIVFFCAGLVGLALWHSWARAGRA